MPTPLRHVLCLAAVAALPLAACGGDDEGSDAGGGSSSEEPAGDAVVVTAVDLAFEPAALEAPAGEITLRLDNEGNTAHTFVFEDLEGDLKLETPSRGDTDDGAITLEEGEYVYYCDVAGHRGAGMEGTLTVGPAAP